MINEHIVRLDRKVGEKTSDMYQWDTGQKLVFDKDDILVGTEVQFDDGSVKAISNKSVEIPDSLLKTSGEKKCWVQIIGSNHETTSYCITFDVIKRQKKNDYIEPSNTSTFRSEMQTLLNAKQNTLTAGENITISGNVISANSTTNIPSWALQTNKPTYTASEVGALPATTVIPTVPTKVSAFENDSGYLTQHQDISGKQNVIPDLESIRSKANSAVQDISGKQDKLTAGENIVINGSVISAVSNDVPDWAMEPNKPNYTASEVGALPSDTVIPVVPTKVSAFENDSGYLTQHQDISGKQDKIEDLEEIRNKANSALQEHQDISGKQDVIFDLDDIRSKANSALQTHVDISGKVDKVTGKGLSENDYTNADKAKVSAIPENPKYTDTVYDDSGVLGDIADLQEADEYTIHYDPDVDEAGSEDAVPYSEYTQKISQLESSISGNSSGITSEASARSSADAAIRQDLANYQSKLVSGENIKTLNNQSILGSGNISISGGAEKEWTKYSGGVSGITGLVLTGCTELMIRCSSVATANVALIANSSIQMVYRAAHSGVTSRVLAHFKDGLLGFECISSAQSDGTSASPSVSPAAIGYSAWDGVKISNITSITWANPSAITSCDLEIWIR